MFAYLYKARNQRKLKDDAGATVTLLEGLSKNREWSELWMELAFIAYEKKQYWEAIGFCNVAFSQENKTTLLWREANKYTDQPLRLISWAYEELGNRDQALYWAKHAQRFIVGPDKDWNDRVARLSRKTVAFHRPGAIGDIIMTLNLIPLWKQQNPDYEVHYFCNKKIGDELLFLFEQAGVEVVDDTVVFESKKNRYQKVYNLVGYPLQEGYPDKPMQRHLLEYFAAEMGVDIKEGHIPSLLVKQEAIPGAVASRLEGQYFTIHATAGWSAYKNWPIERWQEFVSRFPGVRFVQLGVATDPRIEGTFDARGAPLRESIAIFANATAHLGVDSFTNHLTNYTYQKADGSMISIPALILWGSTQYTAAGYPDNRNISLGLSCQPCFKEDPKITVHPRGVCINPIGQTYDKPQHACMYGISVDRVVDEFREYLLEKTGISL
jgi:ADP-heptose:LPS heptosyltransferase